MAVVIRFIARIQGVNQRSIYNYWHFRMNKDDKTLEIWEILDENFNNNNNNHMIKLEAVDERTRTCLFNISIEEVTTVWIIWKVGIFLHF